MGIMKLILSLHYIYRDGVCHWSKLHLMSKNREQWMTVTAFYMELEIYWAFTQVVNTIILQNYSPLRDISQPNWGWWFSSIDVQAGLSTYVSAPAIIQQIVSLQSDLSSLQSDLENSLPDDRNRCINELWVQSHHNIPQLLPQKQVFIMIICHCCLFPFLRCTLIQNLQQLLFASSTTAQPILTPWVKEIWVLYYQFQSFT